ncbi:MAG TPA: beta-ketoacyl-ACP synthase II, partial [Gaiellaceae bacterium]
MRRVAVTGIGAVTPLANDAQSTWQAALAGRSGIDFIRSFDASAFPVRVAAEVKDFDPTGLVAPKEVRRMERNVLFSLAAANEAIADAALEPDPDRTGIVFGSAIGGVIGIAEQTEILRDRGPDRVSPFFIPSVLVDSASGQLAISLGIRGPNYAVVSACATGSHAVGEGAELIKRGDVDVVLAGGTEACMHPLILAGFCAMRGLAVEDEYPPRASRPFDATRAGFVMGEGAGVLVLEDLDTARARGAEVYAEVLGYGASNDAHHMAQPEPEAIGVAKMMMRALDRAGIAPERVGYVNAHGTSTPLGDADAVLAGGAEACITPLILAGFCAMRGLAAEDEYPPRASRPFDATREGFVMGEGACVLVLEDLDTAQARGAEVYAEVLGYGASNDGYHLAA